MYRVLALSALFLISPLMGAMPSEIGGKILYLIHRGEVQEGFSLYLEKAEGEHDFALLQQMGLELIQNGARSEDPEVFMMTLFGAGVATNPSLLPVLKKGLQSSNLKHQLTALNFLGKYQDDQADSYLFLGLSSPFLLTRLETVYLLAKKQDPTTLEQLQTLWVKVPKEVKPLFAQILSKIETPAAANFYQAFLTDNDELVRLSAILEAANSGRDDLLPSLRKMASQRERNQQEACFYALGQLKDTSSRALLRDALSGGNSLAASYALYLLGETEKKEEISQEALQHNLFAITLLGEIEEERELLWKLISYPDQNVALNAALALLKMRDVRVVDYIQKLLTSRERDLGFITHFSPGKAFTAWKIIPSASQQEKRYPNLQMQTKLFRQRVLQLCLELSEESFLQIGRALFEKRETDLIPGLVELLANKHSEAAITLLKENQECAGSPLIRNYCILALFQMGEEGPYEQNLLEWVRKEKNCALIRFKESEPKTVDRFPYKLTPEETSQLLISSFEALASSRSKAGIEALLEAIAYGNPVNKYALAGLLIRTAE